MKRLLLLSLLFTAATHLSAQTDTTIIHLCFDEKPCPEADAISYAKQYKEGDHWKKMVFDKAAGYRLYTASYSDAACTLFDGAYTGFGKDNKVLTTGLYANNKKTGLWKGFSNEGKLTDSAVYKDGFIYGIALSWNSNGTVSDSMIFENNGNGVSKSFYPDGKPWAIGSFKAGKKSGLWSYHYKTGMKCQDVNYEADSALSYTCYEESGAVKTRNCYYEKEAAFKGGDKAWIRWLIGRLSAAKFPKAYNQGKIYGVVHIQFVVDAEGKITDVKTVKSVDPDLDEIAVNIIRQSPAWEPAVQFNRNVKAYRRQPITFPKVE